MDSCGGCRTCEMACSFHHTETFTPELSSIKIFEKKDFPGFRVWIVENGDEKGTPCDGCENRGVPLCMQHCKRSEDLGMILRKYKDIEAKNGRSFKT
jgi:Fe-S-cluster-containing hydrogenase component 2